MHFQVDEDFLAAYQMTYGFTPDGEPADTTTNDIPVAAADVTQTANNQVIYYVARSLVLLIHDWIPVSKNKAITGQLNLGSLNPI